jgi:hypothetical protein
MYLRSLVSMIDRKVSACSKALRSFLSQDLLKGKGHHGSDRKVLSENTGGQEEDMLCDVRGSSGSQDTPVPTGTLSRGLSGQGSLPPEVSPEGQALRRADACQIVCERPTALDLGAGMGMRVGDLREGLRGGAWRVRGCQAFPGKREIDHNPLTLPARWCSRLEIENGHVGYIRYIMIYDDFLRYSTKYDHIKDKSDITDLWYISTQTGQIRHIRNVGLILPYTTNSPMSEMGASVVIRSSLYTKMLSRNHRGFL